MKTSPWFIILALFALAFSLALKLAPDGSNRNQRGHAGQFLGLLMGDGRKLMANQLFTMADVYFHSGYYPSMFDRRTDEPAAIVSASQEQDGEEHEHHHETGDKCEMDDGFMGRPLDWVESFGRNFRITEHTHLEHQNEREILPWLRLAADIDPQKIETYTVGAYFLRSKLNMTDQAEEFLREGLRHNPESCEILFELGRLYKESRHDPLRARNVWLLGIKKFKQLTPGERQEERIMLEQLQVNLARLEEEEGHNDEAIKWFEEAKLISPNPSALQKQIDNLRDNQIKFDAMLVPKVY